MAIGLDERLTRSAGALQAGRAQEAAELALAVLAEQPELPAGLFLAGVAALRLGDVTAACQKLAAAAALQPGNVQCHQHLGQALAEAGKLDAALQSFANGLVVTPRSAVLREQMGIVLARQYRWDEAVAQFREALAIEPQRLSAWLHLGSALGFAHDFVGAVAAHRKVLAQQPDNEAALAKIAWHMRNACDWEGLAEIDARLDALTAVALAEGRAPLEHPWIGMIRHDDPARDQLLSRARTQAKLALLPADAVPFTHQPAPGESASLPASAGRDQDMPALAGRDQEMPALAGSRRLRIGYFCAMWYNHPGMHTLAPLLPEHDRSRVEIFGYGYGRTDDSLFRRRAIAACDRFADIEGLSAVEAARLIHADRLDVLVDLTGHTEYGRTEVLALRPAPVQALWLGYPGTLGAECIDYVIGDRSFLPDELLPFYDEQPVRLPEPFLALGREEPPPGVRFTRQGEGLPPGGTVFCSFNTTVKITPEMLACWLRILDAVPGSVLWLLAMPSVEANLLREVRRLGGDPEQLVFARTIGYSPHLVRAGLADLALDTLGYNGGATTASLLWAGVPVLTAPGRHGPSRLSTSLLRGAGCSELIAADREEYEALAIELGRSPERLAGLRAKLLAERWSSPVFDTARLARHLEQAYQAMRSRFDQGLAPGPIEIGDIG